MTFSANASDNVAVAGVQFRVDGANVGAEDTSAPYAISWDSRQHLNGSHVLTAVARDTSGNVTTSGTVTVTVSNSGVTSTGLKAAYGLDETSGTVAVDSSDSHLNATTVGSTWVAGHFGNAASLDGVNDRIDVPALGTFYKTAFTLEAWVRKQGTNKDVAVVGSWDSSGGPMIWVDWSSGRYKLTLGNGPSTYLDSGRSPSIGAWEHVAATYDGSTARFYVDGVEVASSPFAGVVGNSNTWRIGAYGATPAGFFDGLVDNVRIYDRALSASEVQSDMSLRIQAETTPPTVTEKAPAPGATGVNVGASATATFSEPMNASTDYDEPVPVEKRSGSRGGLDGLLQRDDECGDADAAGGVGVWRVVHGDREGRLGRRHRRGGKSARRRRQLVVHDRDPTLASPGRDLRREPIRLLHR